MQKTKRGRESGVSGNGPEKEKQKRGFPNQKKEIIPRNIQQQVALLIIASLQAQNEELVKLRSEKRTVATGCCRLCDAYIPPESEVETPACATCKLYIYCAKCETPSTWLVCSDCGEPICSDKCLLYCAVIECDHLFCFACDPEDGDEQEDALCKKHRRKN